MIREATQADFEAVMNLYRQMQPNDPAVEDGSDMEAYREILANPRLPLLVLELNSRSQWSVGRGCQSRYCSISPGWVAKIPGRVSPHSSRKSVFATSTE